MPEFAEDRQRVEPVALPEPQVQPGAVPEQRAPRSDAVKPAADITTLNATPVTLGVVLVLGLSLASAIGYVFVKLQTVSDNLSRFQIEHERLAGSINTKLAVLEERSKQQAACPKP